MKFFILFLSGSWAQTFNCDFGDGPNFALFVNTNVPPINKQPGDQDDRIVTLISRDTYDQATANDGPVEVFDDSECHGSIDGKFCFIPNFYIFWNLGPIFSEFSPPITRRKTKIQKKIVGNQFSNKKIGLGKSLVKV